MRKLSFFLTLCLALSACGHWDSKRVIYGQTGQPLCALHHTPLVTSHTFTPDFTRVMIHSTPERDRLEARYPNALPIGHSLVRTREMPEADGHVTYCQRCQQELVAAWASAAR